MLHTITVYTIPNYLTFSYNKYAYLNHKCKQREKRVGFQNMRKPFNADSSTNTSQDTEPIQHIDMCIFTDRLQRGLLKNLPGGCEDLRHALEKCKQEEINPSQAKH